MVEVNVSVEARADMLEIHSQSTNRFGSDVADQYIDGIDRALSRLIVYPELGPVYQRLRPPLRFLVCRSHHIFYDFDGVVVSVIRILHHAMNAQRVFMQ